MGIIENRRSVRKFYDVPIENDIIENIIYAGLQAPSPKNRQPWRFIVIRDKKEKDKLVDSMCSEIHQMIEKNPTRPDILASLETMEIIKKAPILILVCYHYGMVECHDDGVDWPISAKDIEAVELQSIGASVENMLLKAEELGIGGLWCADVLYAYNSISCYTEDPVVSALCLGYQKEAPSKVDKNPIDEMCIYL